jgi:hypothetical protein
MPYGLNDTTEQVCKNRRLRESGDLHDKNCERPFPRATGAKRQKYLLHNFDHWRMEFLPESEKPPRPNYRRASRRRRE